MVISRLKLGWAIRPRVAQKEKLAVDEGGCSSLPPGQDHSQLVIALGQFFKELEVLSSDEPRLRNGLVSICSRLEARL